MTDRALRALGAAAAVAVMALAACSGSDDDDAGAASAAPAGESGGSATEAASPDADAEALVFAECMRSNGVDMPDPAPGQDGFFDAFHGVAGQVDDTTLQDAINACEGFFPTYAGAAHGGDEEAVLALAECLRDQGLDVPDDLFEDGALLDIDEDELRPAMDACRDVLTGADQ